MNSGGVLLDTGPLVALLSRNDNDHELAKDMFAQCTKPLRSCEAVLSEACFLLKAVHPKAPAEVIKLARTGVFEIAFSLSKHFSSIEALMVKYASRPISLADASLILSAELFSEPRILTFDSDFRVYRWARNKRFEILGVSDFSGKMGT